MPQNNREIVWFNWTYQEWWEGQKITYKEYKALLRSGWKQSWNSENWKNQGFTLQETQKWIEAGLWLDEAELATKLVRGDLTTQQYSEKVRNIQEWLDFWYPLKDRKSISKLTIINKKNLTGSLQITDFSNLKELYLLDNKINNLEIINCPKLEKISCSNNENNEFVLKPIINNCPNIVELDFSNSWLENLDFLTAVNAEKLKSLNLSYNCFPEQDLSCFSSFTSLEKLYINHNSFFGSLEPLKSLIKLKELDIEYNNIDPTWEHLFKVKEIGLYDNYHNDSDDDDGPDIEINEELQNYEDEGKYNLQLWKQDQLGYQNLKETLLKINSDLDIQEIINKFEFFNVKTGNILFRGNLRDIFFLFQNKNILFEESLEELVIIIENQKNKIIEDYFSFNTEKELLRKLIISHIEYSTAKQQELDCVELNIKKQELYFELWKKTGKDMMEKVEKIFHNCDILINSGLKLKEKHGLTISFDKGGKIIYKNIQGIYAEGNVSIEGDFLIENSTINSEKTQALIEIPNKIN